MLKLFLYTTSNAATNVLRAIREKVSNRSGHNCIQSKSCDCFFCKPESDNGATNETEKSINSYMKQTGTTFLKN